MEKRLEEIVERRNKLMQESMETLQRLNQGSVDLERESELIRKNSEEISRLDDEVNSILDELRG